MNGLYDARSSNISWGKKRLRREQRTCLSLQHIKCRHTHNVYPNTYKSFERWWRKEEKDKMKERDTSNQAYRKMAINRNTSTYSHVHIVHRRPHWSQFTQVLTVKRIRHLMRKTYTGWLTEYVVLGKTQLSKVFYGFGEIFSAKTQLYRQ